MAADEIHVQDIGTQFKVTIKDGTSVVDVSGASTLQLIFQKPSGTNVTKTASLFTDGTDGIIMYNSESGVLDEAGIWKMQGYIVDSSNSWRSDIQTFRVHRNL